MILTQGQGLTLRTLAPSDEDDLYALLSDPRVMRYLQEPFSRPAAKAFLYQAGMTVPPLIYAVEDDSGSFLGYAIYHAYDGYAMEIGWVLKPGVWGRGYACRMTGLLLALARRSGKGAVIECSPNQQVSRHIAEKYGFACAGTVDGCLVYQKNNP